MILKWTMNNFSLIKSQVKEPERAAKDKYKERKRERRDLKETMGDKGAQVNSRTNNNNQNISPRHRVPLDQSKEESRMNKENNE